MKRCLACLALLIEPVCHVLGIPHPEGLGQIALGYLSTDDE